LVLKEIDLHDTEHPGKVLKDGKTLSQQVKSFEEAVALFLEVITHYDYIILLGIQRL
jgi:hypothetical protein